MLLLHLYENPSRVYDIFRIIFSNISKTLGFPDAASKTTIVSRFFAMKKDKRREYNRILENLKNHNFSDFEGACSKCETKTTIFKNILVLQNAISIVLTCFLPTFSTTIFKKKVVLECLYVRRK